MERDFIILIGNQGYGKSVWAKLYAASLTRLLVFDPLSSYPSVDFNTAPDDWANDVAHARLNAFRYGSFLPDELPIIGNTAFAAGNCTMIVEECALLFRRGEELHDWAKPLVFMGRHQRVSLVLIAQRASKIPVDIRSQASRIVSFLQTEPADVAALCDRIGNSYEETIASLPRLHCLDWDNGNVREYAISPNGQKNS